MVFKTIKEEIKQLDVTSIDEQRKTILQLLIDFIQNKIKEGAIINLNFICTHNSRRSHLSQVWAQALAHYYNLKNVYTYSGGTEATALFPSAAEALESSGFQIEKLSNETNPIYAIKYAETKHPIIGFSKTFDAAFNPSSEFAAIMTCDSANEACPFVPGSEQRIPLTYEDPKAFDNTSQQAEKYKERSLQIATELKYVFANLKE
ncbi:protein-tyrosine-phosphatase [Winogradskyella sp.]|uniref:arsenate-mycothiol transferase ArsC n=1 Tax=Winogradskyella sp. TaxID=1883156 RepID=UPI0026133A2A|nr:protein-tyrosine-phosphatase [Winogradskyella sp.]